MRRRPAIRAVALLTLFAFTLSCATTQLPPISSVGAGFEPLKDEQALWRQAREEEKQILENARLYQDPLLEDYLTEVVGRLNPPGMAANPLVRYRVRVIENPTLNAFAYPHGSLYVHTGLLARMENESQLATVLGHEMTHVEHRHMLRYQRSARNKQIGLAVAAVAAAVVLAGEEADAYSEGKWRKAATIDVLGDLIVGLGLQLAFLASVNGYGRRLELEADQGGFRKLERAGYELREAPRVYEILLDDHGEPSKVEGFFFGSHPRLTERVTNAKAAVAALPPEASASAPSPDGETFNRRIRPVVRDDARLNIEMGRLNLAESQLAKVLEWMPADPETHLLFGRLRLAQAEGEPDPQVQADLRREAHDALRESIRLDADRPEPHRELGLLLYRDGDLENACVEFRHYTRVLPPGEDAGSIRDYLLELEQDGHCPP